MSGIIETMKARLAVAKLRSNLTLQQKADLLVDEAISDIDYRVTILDENFTFVWMDFVRSTTAKGALLDRIKDQAIKMSNKSDKNIYKGAICN